MSAPHKAPEEIVYDHPHGVRLASVRKKMKLQALGALKAQKTAKRKGPGCKEPC